MSGEQGYPHAERPVSAKSIDVNALALELDLEFLLLEGSMVVAQAATGPHSLLLLALVALMSPFASTQVCMTWGATFAAYIGASWRINHAYKRASIDERRRNLHTWHRTMVLDSFAFGCIIGTALVLAFPASNHETKLIWSLILILVITTSARQATLPQLSAMLVTVLVFAGGSWLAWGDWLGAPMATALLALAGVYVALARQVQLEVRHKLQMQARDQQVAQQLAAHHALLAQMSAHRSFLFATASHDLRQPVHALSMMMESLQRTLDPHSLRRHMATATDCVGTLSEMLSNLLDFTLMDSGRFAVRQRPEPLKTTLAETLSTFETIAHRKGLTLCIERTDLLVHTDAQLLRRMVFNLVSNAIKYSPSGTVTVRTELVDGRVVVHVQDQGVGIPADQLSRVFDDFMTCDTHGSPLEMGAGLGLAIVRRCSQLLDHEVTISSEPGRGSRFTIHLGAPVSAAWQDPQEEATWRTALNPVVVILENDPVILESMSEMVRAWGALTVAGASPEQVQQQLHHRNLKPDLILTDLHLNTGTTGFDAIQTLRRRHGGERVPALLLTGDLSACHEAMAAAHHVRLEHKPLPPARLRQVLSALLEPASNGP